METLRDLLKNKNPELYSSFLDTWKYLENNILPLMPPAKESLNSLPHLKNNEDYLNGILPISEQLFDNTENLYLSPYELYVLLTSIALHDIGRITEGRKNEEAKNQIYYSIKVLNSLWGEANHIEFEVFFKLLRSKKIIKHVKNIDNNHSYLSIIKAWGNQKILSKVLFNEELKKMKKIERHSHGYYSKELINQIWDKLGIPAQVLAKAISEVCLIHEPDEKAGELFPMLTLKINKSEIEVIAINQNSLIEVIDFKNVSTQTLNSNDGIIRVNELGSLLSLVDNMDATFRRLVKLNVLQKENYDSSVAIFRDFIESVSYIKNSQAVVVTIGMKFIKSKDECFIIKENKLFSQGEINKVIISEEEKYNLEKFGENNLEKFGENNLKKYKKRETIDPKKDKVKEFNYLLQIEWAFINGLHLDIQSTKKVPAEFILPMILGSVRTCHNNMSTKYKYLSRLGIPVKTWLINFEEHLFNYLGEETYEPVFSKNYLILLAKTMWDLSTRIFGQSFFTYEMLASAANEKDIKMVKLGVKRLEIISRKIKEDGSNMLISAINYNTNGWQWEFIEKRKDKEKKINDSSQIIEIIGKLGEPVLKTKML